MSELDLLCECLSTEGEAEGGGVKFVWMDENTVYRFENNRMKKIGKQLLNRAKKEITKRNKVQQLKQQAADDEDSDDEKPRKKSKKAKKQAEELEDDGLFPKPKKIRRNIESIDDDFDEADEEREDDRPTKRGKKPLTRTKASAALPSVDLDEYYDNKHRMEYMTLEITRLNNKIGKLKQYKSIVNKLTGGEIDDLPSSQSRQAQQAQEADESTAPPPGKQKYNDSLFMF